MNWILLFIIFFALPARASVLGDAANALTAGQWTTIATLNINQTLRQTGGSSGHIFGYTDSIKWDPITRKLFYLGMDHAQTGMTQRFVSYDEATNTWSMLPSQSWMDQTASATPSHGYDHMTIDTAGRSFTVRSPYAGTNIHKYSIDTQTWSNLPDDNGLNGACCAGFEYFPQLNATFWAGGGGILHRLNNGASSWVAMGNFPIGNYHNFTEYSPIHQAVIFGGGNANLRALWKINNAGVVSQLPNAPVDLGINYAVQTVDPVSGDYLIFPFNQSTFYSLNPNTPTWTLRSGSPIANVFGTVATPISSYGVTLFVECNQGQTGNCVVRLYKHWAGGSVDTQPPSSPTGLREN